MQIKTSMKDQKDKYWNLYKNVKDKTEKKYYLQWYRYYMMICDDTEIISFGLDRKTTYKERVEEILEFYA